VYKIVRLRLGSDRRFGPDEGLWASVVGLDEVRMAFPVLCGAMDGHAGVVPSAERTTVRRG